MKLTRLNKGARNRAVEKAEISCLEQQRQKSVEKSNLEGLEKTSRVRRSSNRKPPNNSRKTLLSEEKGSPGKQRRH